MPSIVRAQSTFSAAPSEGKARGASAVTVEKLGKVFRSRKGPVIALRSVTLDIAPRQFVSLLGPSGCGKSTLLRCVAGLEMASEGRVAVGGIEVIAPTDGMGIVFQRDVLLDWLDVASNVLLPAKLQRRDLGAARTRAMELLDMIGLAGFARRHPWELSGGMRQRVAICRALLLDPQLLLMDEPFGALDAMTRDELNVELQRLWLANSNTVLFVTHSIPEAVFLSDRVAVMSRSPGTIVEVLDIKLPRPRPLSIREAPDFAKYVAHIRRIFEGLGMLKGYDAKR
jgi:NitT/TauT family transport system ATP-binding protein